MQNTKPIQEIYLRRELSEAENDFIFMCNNLGFFVSYFNLYKSKYEINIIFDYFYKNKVCEVKEGRQHFLGSLDKISSDIIKFSSLECEATFKRSRMLQNNH